MHLPREVELSHTWAFPGILFPHIQTKLGKLAKNLDPAGHRPRGFALPAQTQSPSVCTSQHSHLELPSCCPGSAKAKLCLSAL